MEEQDKIRSIGQVMQEQGHLLPVTQKSELLKTGALKLLEAIKNKKIVDESPNNLNELFKYCFLLVGLREKNLPNDLETLFLHEFIKKNYGGHSISEIKMAFDMAVRGELDLPLEDVRCYENFSAMYLSSIINSFRRWAREEYRHIEKNIPPPPIESKEKQELHWGQLIEKEYQHYLSFGIEKMKLWPPGFYDQLVKDGMLEDGFRKIMPEIRDKEIGEQINKKQKEINARSRISNLSGERAKFAASICDTNIREAEQMIEKYRSGDMNGVIELSAKQHCILQFFKYSEKNKKQHVYVPA